MHSSSRGGLLGLAALSTAFLISCGGNTGTGSSTPGGTVAVVSGTPATATISLLAGGLGGATFADGTGTNTRFNHPGGIVVDSHGNTFVADTLNDVIREISPAGVVSTFAGITGIASAIDGKGSAAAFNSPKGLAIDSQDTIYVADYGNQIIRKVTSDGTVTTIAGFAGLGSLLDGNGTSTLFHNPTGIAVDATRNVYVADTANSVIRRITPAGDVTTYAGTGTAGSANGAAAIATFRAPQGVAVDSQGNVYVADTGNYCIRKISTVGEVSTLAGTINSPGSIDGSGSSALFLNPSAIIIDSTDHLVVADGNTLREIDTTGTVTTLAGKATATGTIDGTGSSARFKAIAALAFDNAGTVHVADTGNSLIRSMDSSTAVTTVAGSVSPHGTSQQTGTTDNSTSLARFNVPTGLSVDSAGNVYVADTSNNTIRKITRAGVVSTLAGTAGVAGAANGSASLATFRIPTGTAVNSTTGVVYVADAFNNMIRSISPQGGGVVVGVPAGSSGVTGSADGTGAAATFSAPIGVALDPSGNVYVADAGSSIIRKMTPAGAVSTLAGLAGSTGAADGQGQAARFHSPSGLTVDQTGNVYVADSISNTIRKITPDGTVTTLAGSALNKGAADGLGSAASFNDPVGVALDSAGNVYVADSNNFVVRKITLDGTAADGTVSTVVGTPGVEGVVTGTGGTLGKLYGIAVDSNDMLYVSTENSVLKITLSSLPDVALTATPQTLSLGQSTTLNWWSSANTVSCGASDSWAGSQATSGASLITPATTGTLTYSLTCSNADGGTSKKSVSVTVSAAAPGPTLTLSASPAAITLGQKTVLTWSSANAIACGASGNWAGNEDTSGSVELTPTATGIMTYTLSCSNAAQTAFVTKSTTVTVTAAAASSSTSTSSSSSSGGGAAGLDLLAGLGLLGLLRRSRRAAP